MTFTKLEMLDGVLTAAVKFGREVEITSLANHLLANHNILFTQDEVAEACQRLGYYVTVVMKRGRPVRVARYAVGSRRHRNRLPYSGLDIGPLVMKKLDTMMAVGEKRPTREVYHELRGAWTDTAGLTASKFTRCLNPNRYLVKVGRAGRTSARVIERVA